MKDKTNIAELLKDCPKGMKLYSPIFGEVYLDKIRPHLAIVVTTVKEQSDFKVEFLYDGRYGMNGECMLFPSKGKTNWEGFQRPFRDGDIVATESGSWIGITEGGKNGHFIPTYCVIKSTGKFEVYFDRKERWSFSRLATEEEKQKLFDAIKANGYRWNAKTKTLEKLAPNKFDITTLKPFDKVLARQDNRVWECEFFSSYDSNERDFDKFHCVGGWYKECIPYEGNEHLLGTTNDCAPFFKTWGK